MSPRRQTRYTSSDQKVMLPSEASWLIRSVRCHALAIHISTRITNAVPDATEDRKNETGRTGDHHWAPSLSGISRNSEPSELWCMVERVTAAIASITGSYSFPRGRKTQASPEKTTAAAAVMARLRDSR